MPLDIIDLDNGAGHLIAGKGILTSEEFVSVLKDLLTKNRDKFIKYRYSLSDFTKLTKTDITTNDIDFIAKLSREAEKVNPDAVVAIVADKVIFYGLSRMWQILFNEKNWEVSIFKVREDAEAWIKKRIKEKFGIDDPTFR